MGVSILNPSDHHITCGWDQNWMWSNVGVVRDGGDQMRVWSDVGVIR